MMPRSRLLHFSGLILGVLVWLANSGNPPNGLTGAPFDGHCNACHGGGNFNGSVSVDGLPGSILPNTVYPLTITLAPSSGNPNRGGFQLVVVDDNNINSGNLANANTQSGTEFSGGREYLEHRNPKLFGGNPITWAFNWTSPASAGGNMVNFYFIGNFCNGSGTDGDVPIDNFISIPFGGGGPAIDAEISGSTNVTCFGGNNGSATVTATGGTPPLSYTWSNGQTQPTAINLSAGTYTVTVSGGTTATATVVITQPANLNVSASVSGQISCNVPAVNVTANVSGGTGPYNYAWSNGDNFNPASYTTAGAGSVTITDDNGCTKIANFTVNGNTAAPTASASASGTFTCANPTMTLSGAGSATGANISYLWFAGGGGAIMSGGTSLSPTVSGCGTYTLQVRNATNGCTSTASVTPPCSIVLPNLTATGNTLTCAASNVPISASSTTPGVIYIWVGPGGFSSNLPSPTVSVAGTYTVLATNPANGCTRSAAVTVINGVVPPGASAVGGTLTCAAPSLALQGNSSTSGVTYNWTGPGITTPNLQNPIVSIPGTYTVVVTNPATGCTSSATAIVIQDILSPGATAAGGALTCTAPTVTLSGGSAAPGATFSWAGPGGFSSNLQNPVVSVAGTYTLTATTPSNGCTSTATATVTANQQAPGATAVGGTLTCATPSINLSGSSTAATVTYVWVGPNNFASNLQNPSVTAAGTYTLTVLNTANGCTSTATAVVNTNTNAPGAAAVGGTLTCAATTVVLGGSSATSGVSYAWTGPGSFTSALQNPTVSLAGTYTLTVRNPSNGCTSTATASVVNNNTPPGAAATGGTLTCAATTVALSGNSPTSGATYAWTGPNNYASNLQNPVVSAAGNYLLTATNPANGCTSTATAVVNTNTTLPDLSVTNGQLTCTNTSTQICVSSNTPGVSYEWTGPNGFFSAAPCPLVNVIGTYTAIVFNPANGCFSSSEVQVGSNTTSPVLSIAAPDSLHCNAATVAINASNSSQGPGFSFAWSTANGSIQSGGTTAIPIVNAAGIYNLLITNTNNGCTATGSATVVQIAPLSATATAVAVSCNGGTNGSAMATPTGGLAPFVYAWSNGATGAALSNLAAGTYVLAWTDAKGCTANATAVVAQPSALQAAVTTTQQMVVGVNDGSATAVPTGGTPTYTYNWNTSQTTATITGLAPGTYTVTIRDANNCTAVQTANVNAVNCALSTTVSSANVSCQGAANGSAAVTVTGNSGAVTYAWSNSASTAAVSNLSPGTYTVTTTDALLCSQVQNVAISEPPTLVANAMATGQTVVGQNNGTASAAPTGGTPPYSYQWSNNQTTQNISGLAPGGYTLSLTDFNGCTTVQTVSVSALVCTLSAAVGTEAVSCSGGANGTATASIAGAIGTATYLWSTGATGLAITGLVAGTYTVIATDASGCTSTATGTVNQPQPLQVTATVLNNVPCPLDPSGQVGITVAGGTAPYLVPSPVGYPAGTYNLVVTDALGCTANASFSIVSTDTQAPSITCPPNAVACENTTVFYTLPVVADNCTPGTQLALLSGQPSGSQFNVGVTTQVFRATDASGNTATCSFSVRVNLLPAITFVAAPDTNNIGKGTIQLTVSAGTPPYTFVWLKNGQFYSNEEDLNNLGAGSYQVEVSDANGCKKMQAPIVISNIVGSHEPDWLAALKLFPNPASEVLYLEAGDLDIVAVRILTTQGRLVQTLHPANGFRDIPVGTLPAGMYYLQVRTKEGGQGLLKWVKGE